MVCSIGIPGSLEFLLGKIGELDYGYDGNNAFDRERLKFHNAHALCDETKEIAKDLAEQAAELAPSYKKLMRSYRKGFLAELDVINELESVIAHEYLLLNNVHLYKNGYLCQLDHVLLGPSGIDLIEAKSWSEEYQTGDRKRREYATYDQMMFQADALEEYLGLPFNKVLFDKDGTFRDPPDDINRIYPGELRDLITQKRVMDKQTMQRAKIACARKVKPYEH